LAQELRALQDVSGFISAAIARRDGLPIHHTFRSPREALSLCATAAAVVGSSVAAGEELDEGGFAHGIVQYRRSTLVLAEAGPEAIVVFLLLPGSNQGHALLAIRKVALKVQEILERM
jgi:predicted regulator of Ras-like GTPase activity (Roadblock/LC7/MglB family)